ncbi:hypothetical protein P3L10_026198 [Capsicum annuum]
MIVVVVLWFATVEDTHCSINGLPLVRNISELQQHNYARPGLSHTTIAGSVLHDMKEIDVWLQTSALVSSTPIQNHSCQGTLYLAPSSHSKYLGNLKEFHIFPNSTFHIPFNDVHQVNYILDYSTIFPATPMPYPTPPTPKKIETDH